MSALPDMATRVRLAAGRETPAELLAALSRDPAITVRAAVALNAAAPDAAEDLLAADPDERVRVLLARRLATIVPTLPPGPLGARVARTLAALVADEALGVRAAIADALQSSPGAPRDLILRLVRDAEVAVGGAVIELSPVLTSQDLISLLTGPDYAAGCVARRPGLPPEVCDAIVAHGQPEIVRALLANGSANIREATLDALAAHAAPNPGWHDPLVRRPALSKAAMAALSRIVSAELLRALAGRPDVDPALLEDVRRRLAPAPPRRTDEGWLAEAHALRQRGRLDEAALLAAIGRGEAREASALLATAAGTSLASVDRAATLRSAKGLVSLVWQAGYTMRAGCAVQALLAQLGPGQLLPAGPGGAFPLAVEEMRWQVEFLARRA